METPKANANQDLGGEAALQAATIVRHTIENAGVANLLAIIGASQFETLANLMKQSGIS